MLQTSQAQLSKIEAGITAPTLYQLMTIKKLCDESEGIRGDMSWAWLLEGVGHIDKNSG